ncbi:Tetratricopeptide TPR_2 repeat protein [Magnetococcus marinus MC-1]|uniref:Tetratricopeptide TPR_2 repeat protein n=1 Tax=Magnetococcus marinus (strain ATCC BAA-1437 / JCM 17883 / MC-1) TaxID=156889 RepID=A0L5U3_MAGMM|nr:tetratricopeptide repeat protein [Magnetococcus marinus]ABK43336.1 Tetratricopeptide TPR_2 repeat protein [Magnetococcus marinus MC-1]
MHQQTLRLVHAVKKNRFKTIKAISSLVVLGLVGCTWAVESGLNQSRAETAAATTKEPHIFTPEERLADATATFSFLVGHLLLQERDWKGAEAAFTQVVESDPGAVESQVMVARLAMQGKDYEKALVHARKVVDLAPEHELARRTLATILRVLKRYPEAVVQYEELLKQDPDDSGVRLVLAQLYGRIGRAAESSKVVEALLSHPLIGWRAELAVGRGWLHQDDQAQALAAFERARAMAPEQLEPTLALGSVLQDLKKNEEAEAIYRRYLDEHPRSEVVHTRLGRLLLNVDDREGALAVFSNLQRLAPSSVQAHLSSAFILLSQERYEEALGALRLAEVQQPENSSIRYYLGQALEYLKRDEEAVGEYAKVQLGETFYPESQIRIAYLQSDLGRKKEGVEIVESLYKSHPTRVDVVLALNFLQLQNDQYEQVIQSTEEGLKLDPEESRFLFNRAMAYDKLGKWKEAEADLEAYIKVNPNDAHALNYLGYTWADRNENLEGSLELLKKAAKLAPGDGFITDSLGWVLFRMNRLSESVDAMREAVRLQPDDATIVEHLGDVLKALGRDKEAANFWQKYLKISPDNANLKEKLRQLNLP